MNAILPSVSASYRPQARIQAPLRTLHLLLGLSLGILLVTQGLSGSILVWRPELEQRSLPKAASAARRGALDAEAAAVRRAAPQGTMRMVRFAEKAGGSDAWNLAAPAASPAAGDRNAGAHWTVYVDPSTAAVLGARGRQRDLLGILIELHHNLFAGTFGRAVLGYVAIATILMALSGLWLWWPAAWTWSRVRPRAAARPLHYALGFWAMGPLLLIATTALYFVWRQPIQRAFGVAGPQNAVARPGSRGQGHDGPHREGSGRQPLAQRAEPSLDSIVATATAAMPTERLVALRFPDKPGEAYAVFFEPPRQHYRAAPDSVRVRMTPDGRAHLESILRWDQMPLRQRFLEWLPRIHQAEVGGIPLRILWSVTGLLPSVLYVTGFLMWRRRVLAAKSFSLQASAE